MSDLITVEQYRGMKQKATSKYRNVQVKQGGIKFDSIKEWRRFVLLSSLVGAGKIYDLKCQQKFKILIGGVKVCSYIADFTYKDKNGVTIVEDVKSEITRKNPVYRIKKKLMMAVHKIQITEV